MVQIIVGAIIIAIGFFVFLYFPIKKDVKSLLLASLIILITVILKRLSIMVPLFGAESLKIGIELIPMMIAGMMLSPSYCFLIGIGVDTMGLIISPTGFPFLGFTLNSILQALLPSLCMVKLKKWKETNLHYLVTFAVFLICSFGLVFVWSANQIYIGDTLFVMTTLYKIMCSIIILLLFITLQVTIHIMKNKLTKDNIQLFYIWIIAVLCVEIIITFLLTPYWLETMYGIPYFLSLALRVFKAFIMIPLDIILGFMILKTLKKRIT